MKTNKVLDYQKSLLIRARARTSKACKAYEEAVKANIRFFMNNGFFNKELQDKEMEMYLAFVDRYMKELLQEEKYLRVKGCEGALCLANERSL